MPSTLAKARTQAEIKSSDGQLTFGPSTVVASQEPVKALDARWILTLLVKALDDVMARKSAAFTMKIDQAQLTRQLATGNLTLLRASDLGEDYWRQVWVLLGERFNLLDRDELIRQGDAYMDRAKVFYAKAAQR